MTIRVLLLDAGNTLVYLDHHAVAEIAGLDPERVLAAEKPAKRRYELLMKSGRVSHNDGWPVFMKSLIEGGGATGDLDAQVQALWETHRVHNLWRRVPEGLSSALLRAREAGIRLGVISNSEGGVEQILSRVGLATHFELIIDSNQVGVSKPDPAIFNLAINHFDVEPHQALYAGDIPEVDVDGARSAGLAAALIDTLDHYPDYKAAPKYRHTSELIGELISSAAR